LSVHPYRRAIAQNNLDQAGGSRCRAAGQATGRYRGCRPSVSEGCRLRRQLYLGKATNRSRLCRHQCSSPVVELTGADAVPARHVRWRGLRRHTLGRDHLLLFNCPAPPPFPARDQIHPRHRCALMTARMSARCRRNQLGRDRVRLHQPNAAYLLPSPLCGNPTTLTMRRGFVGNQEPGATGSGQTFLTCAGTAGNLRTGCGRRCCPGRSVMRREGSIDCDASPHCRHLTPNWLTQTFRARSSMR
jgi:hypothetical protein